MGHSSERGRRRASGVVALGVTAALATTLTGCSSDDNKVDDQEYAQICRDQQTEERLPDEECENRVGHSHMSAAWFFLPLLLSGNRGDTVPAVGSAVPQSTGSATSPGGAATHRAPSQGGSGRDIARGGFGSSGGGAGNGKNNSGSGHGSGSGSHGHGGSMGG